MSYTHDDCYSCSRERRRRLFSMAQETKCSTIAFGHHKDDNAQTLLMNLLHKAEFAGLLPKIHLTAYNTTIVRPLIYLEEKDKLNLPVCGRPYETAKKDGPSSREDRRSLS